MHCTLVRHPPTINTQGLCYGRLEVAVEPRVMHACAQQLTHLRGLPVYSSPAQRCLQLAYLLTDRPIICPELQELDFGCWEGLAWDDISRTDLDAWAADIDHYRVGVNGETAHELAQRWQVFRAQRQTEQAEQHIVVISHAGIIRNALVEAGLINEAQRWSQPIAYATSYLLEW